MQKIDQEKAARVWQRVQNSTTSGTSEEGLTEMIARAWTNAATYLQLSRRLQGKDSAALRRLHEQSQSHTACLKGIYTLLTGAHPSVKAVVPELGDTQAALRHCYGQEMRCLAAYEARSRDPEYGQVFLRLAMQEQEHCRTLLEVLGNLKK